ncbi:Uncharacterised protein [Mycobacteroides abscessus subsp. abscessus]|nr:Uncharacterised protein [Mycobacteroides abscessus subsp. abscessus]
MVRTGSSMPASAQTAPTPHTATPIIALPMLIARTAVTTRPASSTPIP